MAVLLEAQVAVALEHSFELRLCGQESDIQVGRLVRTGKPTDHARNNFNALDAY
jgi:hypothetical protein